MAAAAHDAAAGLKRVGIFTATRWEQAAVSRAIRVEERTQVGRSACVVGRGDSCRVYVFRTGIGPVMAGAVCREVFAAHSLDLAISSGFACALIPAHIGDVLIATEVRSWPDLSASCAVEPPISCDAGWSALAASAARDAGVAAHTGGVISLPEVLWRADQKRRMAGITGVAGLDMESGAIGHAAAERQVPFLAARSVSDLQDEDLPLDFNLFLRPAGWPRGVMQILSSPSSLAGLRRLRRQSRVAGDQLTRFMRMFLARVGQAADCAMEGR